MLQHIRLALRRMRRYPLFAWSAAGTLAIGVAAATSIYTVVDGVLLKPLPFRASESLVRVTSDYGGLNLRDVGLSQPELEDFARRSGAFEALSGIWPITANLTGSDRPERIEALLASPNYFDLLGAHAALGRTFTPADAVPGIATVAVISDGLWHRGFGGDPGVLGRTLRIDEDVYEIVGVMPPSFRHPTTTLETDVDLWAPAGWTAPPFNPPGYSVRFMPAAIGRLAPGVSVQDGAGRLEGLARVMAAEHPDDYPSRLGWVPRVHLLSADLVAGVRPALLLLMAAIVCVLLIAISNISNLLLIRAVEREREIAIQRALGASRSRIMTSLLVEGGVLALAGGAAGFLASLWGVDLLMKLAPDRLPRSGDIHVDHRAFLFALGTSLAAGVLMALAPAIQSARTAVVEQLKASGRSIHGGAHARARNALVVIQVAVAVVLLTASGLLVRSLQNIERIDTGIRLDTLLTARLWLPQPNDPSAGPYFDHRARVTMFRRLLDHLATAPDIQAAGLATSLPATTDSGTTAFAVDGWTPDRRDLAAATVISVTPGYFPTLGMSLVSGRLLDDTDDDRRPRAAVVNETFARTYFAGAVPAGARFHFVGRRGQVPANAPWISIVGVVADVREDALDAPVRPAIYQSLWQTSTLNMALVARGRTGPPSPHSLDAALAAADHNLPLYAVRTGDGLVASQLAQRLFATRLINAFAAAALLLAAFGLHGVTAYGVRQRTHEIGVRVALGATAVRIMGLVLGQAAKLTAIGVAIGLLSAAVTSRLMGALLFGAHSSDPLLLSAVVLILAAVVGAATVGAARRAARIDAAVALRE